MYRNNLVLRTLIREVNENSNIVKIKSLPISMQTSDIRSRINMEAAFDEFFTDIVSDVKNDFERSLTDPDFIVPVREISGEIYDAGDWDRAGWKLTIGPSLDWADFVLEWSVQVGLKKGGIVMNNSTLKARGYPREIHQINKDSFQSLTPNQLSGRLSGDLLAEVRYLIDEIRREFN